MNKFGSQMPYVASYAIVKNEKGKIAFVHRSNTTWMNNHYGLPSGKTEKNEKFSDGAIREAKEEIGITVKPDHAKHVLTMHRRSQEVDGTYDEWVDIFFEITKFTGEPFNAEPHMHSELAWFYPDKLPNNTIPNVAVALNAYIKGERYIEYGWE